MLSEKKDGAKRKIFRRPINMEKFAEATEGKPIARIIIGWLMYKDMDLEEMEQLIRGEKIK